MDMVFFCHKDNEFWPIWFLAKSPTRKGEAQPKLPETTMDLATVYLTEILPECYGVLLADGNIIESSKPFKVSVCDSLQITYRDNLFPESLP
jgi:hypothetical protein